MLTTLKLLANPRNIMALVLPFRPALSRAFLIMIGIALGMILVYLPFPALGIKFTSGDPVHLLSGNKDTWVKNTAYAYSQGLMTDADAKAALENAGYGPKEVEALANANAGTVYESSLRAVQTLPDQAAADKKTDSIKRNAISTIMPAICWSLLCFLGIILGIVLSFVPIPIGPWRKGAVSRDSRTAGMGEAEHDRREALKLAKAQASEPTDETANLGEPMASFMSAYVLGDNLFDDSFAIEPIEEDGSKGFAGECGIGISETIGVGDPKKVTALEVWVFDQAEIQTLTYVLMSEYAYNDPSLRDKLAPRGEAVMATPGMSFMMETKSVRMHVKVLALEYGEGSLPPNSFFGQLTVSLAVWLKESDGSEPSMPTPIMPLPQMQQPPIQPMAQPMGNYAPPTQPMPMQAPPQQMPPQGGMPPQGYPQQPMMPPGQMPPGQMPQGMPPRPMPGQMPPGQMPQGMPPQGMPPRPMPGQMPPGQMPPQGGMPPQGMPPQQGRAPMPPQGGQPPLPGRPVPPDDDPFGETGQM